MPGRRILVVDDDPRLVHIVSTYLTIEGYDVVVAGDGDEALEKLAVAPVDLVILDVMMPGLGGIETCRRLKGDPRFADIPVVVFTALSREADVESARRAGADRFVTKPFSLIGLDTVIRSCLGDPLPVSPTSGPTRP